MNTGPHSFRRQNRDGSKPIAYTIKLTITIKLESTSNNGKRRILQNQAHTGVKSAKVNAVDQLPFLSTKKDRTDRSINK
jgi:hypothetical protein